MIIRLEICVCVSCVSTYVMPNEAIDCDVFPFCIIMWFGMSCKILWVGLSYKILWFNEFWNNVASIESIINKHHRNHKKKFLRNSMLWCYCGLILTCSFVIFGYLSVHIHKMVAPYFLQKHLVWHLHSYWHGGFIVCTYVCVYVK
jgi:hypothetical protein